MGARECPGYRVVALLGTAALPGAYDDVAGVGNDRALRALAHRVEVGAASGVTEDPRWMVTRCVLLAPPGECEDRGPQCPARFGEVVFGVAAVGRPAQHAGVDECVEAVAEYGAGDVEVDAQITESADAVEAIANDQQRPAFTDYLECSRDVALLLLVSGSQRHGGQSTQKLVCSTDRRYAIMV